MMTSQEMERRLNTLTEVQIVQGELLDRVEQAVARNAEAIAQNTEAIAAIAAAVTKLSDGLARQNDGMIIMQAAMERLFDHMDRFIRGLESNGHKG